MHVVDHLKEFHIPAEFPLPSRRYTAVHDSGLRKLSAIRNVVIHCTESETAESAASWFANPLSEGSAHFVLGNYAGFRTLDDSRIPWAAPPLNSAGIHIEIVGYAEFTAKEWSAHTRAIQYAAWRTAIACHQYKIIPDFLTRAQLAAHSTGITSHRDISAVFGQSTHTDPGANFPYRLYMDFVDHYFRSLEERVKVLV